MVNNPDEIQKYVEQTALLINLPIDQESMPGVVDNLQRIAQLATLVTDFALPEDMEPAPIFQP